MSKSISKSERTRHAKHLKQLFAAYHFLNTSRDGAVIAQMVGVTPITLHYWAETDNWIKAIFPSET